MFWQSACPTLFVVKECLDHLPSTRRLPWANCHVTNCCKRPISVVHSLNFCLSLIGGRRRQQATLAHLHQVIHTELMDLSGNLFLFITLCSVHEAQCFKNPKYPLIESGEQPSSLCRALCAGFRQDGVGNRKVSQPARTDFDSVTGLWFSWEAELRLLTTSCKGL